MPLLGKRNLVLLFAIKILVIGLFISGCQEGTNKSPISALFISDEFYGEGDLKKEIYNNGSIVGRIISDKDGNGQNGLYVMLYEWKEKSKSYDGGVETGYELGEFVAATRTHGLVTVASSSYFEIGSSSAGGYFEFTKLSAANYCLYFGNASDTPVFQDEKRDGSKVLWKYFETDTTKAPNYKHSARYIAVENNKELAIFTSY